MFIEIFFLYAKLHEICCPDYGLDTPDRKTKPLDTVVFVPRYK